MLRMRMAEPADAPAIGAIYRPIVNETIISFELEPPDDAEIARRISATLMSYPWLVATDGTALLGYAYASRYRERRAYQWAVDVSVYVAPTAQRRGVGRVLYTTLFELLALQGFVAAHAGIALPNPASIALHKSLGFRPIGVYHQVGYKLGSWHDVGWWQRRLGQLAHPPHDPLSLAAARVLPEWEKTIGAG